MLSTLLLALSLPILTPTVSAAKLYAPIQLSLELGSIHAGDPNFDTFNSDSNRLPTQGVRVGYAFNDHISLVGGWHHGARGSDVGFGNDEMSSFRAAYYGNEFTLGARGTLPVTSWLQPFASLQVIGMQATVRFDEDPEDDENLNQLSRSAFSPGGMATLGVEALAPMAYGEWAFTSDLELGYGYVAPQSFDDLNDLEMHGFVLRWGVGVRF
jgi:hypothetical protein